MKRRQLLLGAAALAVAPAAPAACAAWPDWERFRDRFVEAGGRVIDPSDAALHTTSEGQSYGLFFALAANDRPAFERLLRWTEDNLAGGDLTGRLPAWRWGRQDGGGWGVLDANAAADADLWIVYALAEAARLWAEPKYAALARLLGDRILNEETAAAAGLGQVLLPGPRGFTPQPGSVRLNPSYLPLQLLRRMAVLYPDAAWKALYKSSLEVTVRAAPAGFAPDWIVYRAQGGFQPDAQTAAAGSYNAIRVYLWAGMLAPEEPARAVLLRALAPMARAVAASGVPPETVQTRTGRTEGGGPAGFSAALLPFLAASGQAKAAQQQRLRVAAKAPLERTDNYYDQVLTLFGLGWAEGRFRFARDGSLLPNWKCAAR